MRKATAAFSFLVVMLSGLFVAPTFAQTADDYGNGTVAAVYCPRLTVTLQRGSRDANTGGQVSELQSFLTDYYDLDDNLVAGGFFGKLTQKYVIQFQREQGLPSLGIAGSLTRAAIARVCNSASNTTHSNQISNGAQSNVYAPTHSRSSLLPDSLRIVSPAFDTAIGVGQKIVIQYSVGGNIVAGDPAIVERKIVRAYTDTSAAGYIPVSVSGGTHSFEWIPSEAGTYQVLLSISHNNTTYPARSAIIKVGGGNTGSTPSNSTPSVVFSYVSSGNVIGSFVHLPSNTIIRLVSAATGQPYLAQGTLVENGGSGSLSIPIPNDLPSGLYYLRAMDGTNQNISIAQSASFQAGSNMQTGSVVIDSFTASPSSVNAGAAVMFMWSSNLTQNDINYYGGGCSIEGLANNTALYVTKAGFTGASGQVTFVPPATGTYTLRCSSGAKDGSPMATRQIAVNVGQAQTNPVVISSFTSSQTSISSGQPVTFTWNSNLTSTDISYGGACNIEGLGNNTALYVSQGSGSYGASGSITYMPAFTAVYTLRCYSGGKDGSPMDSRQVTVNVN